LEGEKKLGNYSIGFDVGGTFTDTYCIDEYGEVITTKTLTTPDDITEGVITGIKQLELLGYDDVGFISHASTQACNAVITYEGAKTAIITTVGFKDQIEIRRGQRVPVEPNDMYNLQANLPQGYIGALNPLIERPFRYEINERIGPDGRIIKPLDEGGVKDVIADMKKNGIESVAICYVNCFANPDHELRTERLIKELAPEIEVSVSSQILPIIREYERLGTAVVNAYIKPLMKTYLHKLQKRINDIGIKQTLHIMQSNGGIVSAQVAGEFPVNILESGPASGVIAVAKMGARQGIKNVIAFDMGGTTAKCCAIVNGIPQITKEFWINNQYLVCVPIINLVEIGAGGGSIAWVDRGKALQVGPQSAGASPGPACYGFGGEDPSITDCNLILGYLNPDYFLGGQMKIDTDKAKTALKEKVCSRFGDLPLADAALGVHNLANVKMMAAIRQATLQKGFDPREFTLVATGGAGPAHVCRMAQELEIPEVIIPRNPGTYSAVGLLIADAQYSSTRSYQTTTKTVDLNKFIGIYDELKAIAREPLHGLNYTDDEIELRYTLAMRYSGQSHEIDVVLDGEVKTAEDMQRAEEKFHSEHQRLFGHHAQNDVIQIITLSITGVGKAKVGGEKKAEKGAFGKKTERFATRKVFFEEYSDYVDCPIYRRHYLVEGDEFDGPAVIEERHSATVVPPGCSVRVNQYHAMQIKIGKA